MEQEEEEEEAEEEKDDPQENGERAGQQMRRTAITTSNKYKLKISKVPYMVPNDAPADVMMVNKMRGRTNPHIK